MMTENLGIDGLTLGDRLKKAREAMGLSAADIADLLRIKYEIIEKIESDGFSDEEVSVFIRGYFRAYAKQVHVPQEEIDYYFTAKGVMQIPKKVPPQKFKLELLEVRQHHYLRWMSIFVIVVMVILVLVFAFMQRDSLSSNISTQSASSMMSHPAAAPIEPQVIQGNTPSTPLILHSVTSVSSEVSSAPAETNANANGTEAPLNTQVSQNSGDVDHAAGQQDE